MNETKQDLIDRYLRGEMNAEEKSAFESQLAVDAELREQYDFTAKTIEALKSRKDKLKSISRWNEELSDRERELHACMVCIAMPDASAKPKASAKKLKASANKSKASAKLKASAKPTKKKRPRRLMVRLMAAAVSVAAIVLIAFYITIPTGDVPVMHEYSAPNSSFPGFVMDDVMPDKGQKALDSLQSTVDSLLQTVE